MEEIRTRFEHERVTYVPPRVSTPEELAEVEDMLFGDGDESYDAYDEDEYADLDDSFVQQGKSGCLTSTA